MTMIVPQMKPLALALGAALAALSQGVSAVYQSNDGQGQVLIYPYYTVQSAGGNAFNTYLSVVNATASAKAAKVRFREGKNGRSVLDFNLFLSPNDVWTAAIGPSDGSSGAPAKLVTADKSCTSPAVPAGGLVFNNFSYSGTAADGGPTTLDRTREGYFEIIEMATLTGNAVTAVTQNSAGVPVDCSFVQSSTGLAGNFISAPTGGLAGTYVLINVANGLSFSGNATALSQFSATTLYTNPGDTKPDLTSANPPFASTTFQNSLSASSPSGPALLVSGAMYANGRDAVSAVLMKSFISNEYVLDAATQSATDWIVSFPTKAFYVAPGTGAAVAPFAANFGTSGSCEPISFMIFNREEAQPTSGDSCGPFPECSPGIAGPALCWNSSVLSFNAGSSKTPSRAISSVFGSTNMIVVGTQFSAGSELRNGWFQVGFIGTNAFSAGLSSVNGGGQVVNLSSGATTQSPGPPSLGPPLLSVTVNHRGLPAIGFMARTLNNGLLSCTTFGGAPGTCAGSYGALMDHRYLLNTTPVP